MKRNQLDKDLIRYINSKLERFQDHWLWTGACSGGKKPIIDIAGKTMYVTRVVWEYVYGTIPEGIEICHTCDIPKCISIDHLFAGTHADNMIDKAKKGRANRVLTEDQAREVFYRYNTLHQSQTQIAKYFGVDTMTINRILNNKTYVYLTK
jgi:hypothetical protein